MNYINYIKDITFANNMILYNNDIMNSIQELKDEFHKLHKDVTLANDIILHNDVYMKLLIGNTIIVNLDTKREVNKIDPQENSFCQDNLNNCKLSYYDIEKLEITKNYATSIAYKSKYINSLNSDIRKYSIYDPNNFKLFTLFYLLKRFNIGKMNIIYIQDHDRTNTITNINGIDRLFGNKFIITEGDFSHIKHYLKESTFIHNMKDTSMHNYSDYVFTFIEIYNELIKLEKNKNTYIIFVRPLLLTKLQFQIIDILKSFFEEAKLIKPKFDSVIDCYLILKNKNKLFDPDYFFDIEKYSNILSISNQKLNEDYIKFYDLLTIKFNNSAHLVTVFKLIKQNNKKEYNRIKYQIKIYRDFYMTKIMKQIENKK